MGSRVATAKLIAEIRTLSEAATPAPWDIMEARTLHHLETAHDNPNGAGISIASFTKARAADANFCRVARAAVPKLLQHIEALEAQLADATLSGDAIAADTTIYRGNSVRHWYDKARAYRAAAEREAGLLAPEPIATAPRLGRFLVYGGECSGDVRPEDTWLNEGWCMVERDGDDFNVVNIAYYGVRVIGATHWMPEPGKPA